MQRVTFVRYTAKPGHADENERLSRAVFTELRARQPAGIAYALCRNGDDFTHIFLNLAEDDSDVLTGLESFKAFSADGPARHVAPPEVIRLSANVVEAYGFERAPARA